MATLARPIQIKFRVTDREKIAIRDRMKVCGIGNMSRYLRTMAINGCIIKPDYSPIKQTNAELHKIGVNLNQIAKKVNETGNIHANEIHAMQEMMERIWQLQLKILKKEV